MRRRKFMRASIPTRYTEWEVAYLVAIYLAQWSSVRRRVVKVGDMWTVREVGA